MNWCPRGMAVLQMEASLLHLGASPDDEFLDENSSYVLAQCVGFKPAKQLLQFFVLFLK